MATSVEYNAVLEEFLRHPELSKIIQQVSTKDYLNLMSLNWKDKLDNHAHYQDLKKDVSKYIQSSYSKENVYNFYNVKPPLMVAVIAQCSFIVNKNNDKITISVKEYSPLTEIGKTILSDLDDFVQKVDEFRLTFGQCSVKGNCHHCSKAFKVFGNDPTMGKIDEPCILDTQVFDGKNAYNRFLSQINSMFHGNTFFAICLVEVNSRYSYKLEEELAMKYRVSGTVHHLIAFDKRKLVLNKELCLGPVNIMSAETAPSAAILEELENPIVDNFEKNKDTPFGKRSADNTYIEAYPKKYQKQASTEITYETGELMLE